MEIIIRATPEEAAALANLLQGRQTSIAEQVAQKISACLEKAMRDTP